MRLRLMCGRPARAARRPVVLLFAVVLVGAAFLPAGCGSGETAATVSSAQDVSATSSSEASTTASALPDTTTASADAGSAAGSTFFDDTKVHSISVTYVQAAYDAMIQTYKDSGTKDWIEATVTIDGTTYEHVGMRLKGNSSIRGLRGEGAGRPGGPGQNASADDPGSLPWLIRLDKNIKGQNHDGLVDLVVRSNTTKTSLNEAVSVQLLDMAGLASVRAVETRFTVNGGDATLRLVTELPAEEWMEEHFGSGGSLYKADASGDYSYRGTDPQSYENVFDQEAGDDNADLTPLIEFLDFINNAPDVTFASELPDRLDVDAFATYLAMEQLLGNFDDIDGPGNNSYLYYNTDTGKFTVVPWDHNLAFGGFGGRANATGASAATQPAAGGQAGGQGNGQGPSVQGNQQPGQEVRVFNGKPGGKSNILVERFHANAEFEKLYQEKLSELTTKLYTGGVAAQVLARWVELLKAQASDLVTAATIDQEAARITAYFTTQ